MKTIAWKLTNQDVSLTHQRWPDNGVIVDSGFWSLSKACHFSHSSQKTSPSVDVNSRGCFYAERSRSHFVFNVLYVLKKRVFVYMHLEMRVI